MQMGVGVDYHRNIGRCFGQLFPASMPFLIIVMFKFVARISNVKHRYCGVLVFGMQNRYLPKEERIAGGA